MAVRADAAGKRVLVVGAGPSGLSAAYHHVVVKTTRQILLLEQQFVPLQ